jgi:hypothetical protein
MRKRVFLFLLNLQVVLFTTIGILHSQTVSLDNFQKGRVLYECTFRNKASVINWKMEGPGLLEFRNGWMEMYSPGEEYHHVFWGPQNFPGSFISEWEVKNLNTDLGLCIIFFAAKGKNGEDIFDPAFPERDGTFEDYTRSDYLNCYHISYYANGKAAPGRSISHLRKNSGFHLVYTGEPGIPIESEVVHKLTLVKDGPNIMMFLDGRKIIDWTDDGKEFGPVLNAGRIGLRQMRWTRFAYRNFKVWELK